MWRTSCDPQALQPRSSSPRPLPALPTPSLPPRTLAACAPHALRARATAPHLFAHGNCYPDIATARGTAAGWLQQARKVAHWLQVVEEFTTFVMADLNKPLPSQSMNTKTKINDEQLKPNIPKWVRTLPAGVVKVESAWCNAWVNSKYYYEQGFNCYGEIIYFRTRRTKL